MVPILYDKTGNVKIGELTNCIECLVEEERNGLFEVSLIYPVNDTLFNSLEEENIIVCNANDTLLNQKFRIYMTRKLMSNKIEVFARHISFDLAYDYINSIDLENQSCEYALNTIFRNSQFSTHYKGYSDIINAQDYKISKVNCIEAIGGTSGSILDTFGTGAEILRDNTNIHVLNKRGYDNEVSIEYAKNLTGFELEEDYTDLITRIIPFASYTDNETNEEILVEANAVDSDYISNYSHPYISYMDFSEKFEDEEIPTTSKLIELARKYFLDNECDKPKQNFKIEFVPLSKCVGYEGIQDNISLCDTVTIKDTRFNIDTKAKVIKTVFNVLKNKYESMELGEPRTALGDIINSSGSGEDGKQGPPGPQGPPGVDGSIGDFPNSLPSTPVLSANVYGFASIELNWTYENKVYYNYELYASKTKNFIPNTFDLIHAGQTSSYLFQAKPNETWYFRVCAVNTHGERTPFSDQITVTTVKVDNLENYFTDVAIGNAVVGSLTADYMSAGIIKGNWIDAKNLSVTDGNGKRTLDVDSFGNVHLDVTTLTINSQRTATENYADTKGNDAYNNSKNYTDSRIQVTNDSILSTVSNTYATKSEVQQTSDDIKFSFTESGGQNLLSNSAFKNGTDPWKPFNNAESGIPVMDVLTDGNDWALNNRNVLEYKVYNMDATQGVQINSGFTYFDIPAFLGQEFTFSCLVAAHRINDIWIQVHEISPTGSTVRMYQTNVNHPRHGGKNRNDWNKVNWKFTILDGNTNRIAIRLFMQGWNDGSLNSVHMWMAEPILIRGHYDNVVYTPNADEVYSGITTIDKDGIKVTSSQINGYTHMTDRGFFINKNGEDVFRVDPNGLYMKGDGHFTGKIETGQIINANGGIYTGQDIRGYDPTGVSGGLTLVTGTGHLAVRTENPSHNVYLQPAGGEVKVTAPSDPNTFSNLRAWDLLANNKVYANGVALTSNRDKKKNIEDYTESALHEICTTPIRKYHLKDDLDNELKRIGIVVQEAPLNAIDLKGECIDLYQMVSMSWKAIQELKEENNNLKLELEEFKKVVK
jgi:phage minor structural protein